MKGPAQRVFVLAVCIVVIMLIAGCEEGNLSNAKKSGLIADENMQLKKDLEQCNREIEKQKELLAKCLQQKESSQEQMQKIIEDLSGDTLSDFEEIMKLREENEKLKAQIEQLHHELDLRPKPEAL